MLHGVTEPALLRWGSAGVWLTGRLTRDQLEQREGHTVRAGRPPCRTPRQGVPRLIFGGVFAFCFVFTPNEFRSAGLTVQNMFSSWLGSEDVSFVQYHVKRTSITLIIHSSLPLGYYAGMCITAPEKNLAYIHVVSAGWLAFLVLSLCLQLEVELCIGCMQVPAGTKLIRLCCEEGSDNESECRQCFCRPMWCLSCLGRWFASRQDQDRPETWLASCVPCPTCRSKFCILDVCLVR
ncbi:hypothetical protein CRUP_030348 [Coryphaenoides rupestris]|nr:hypothetical protein CRUP_030348 [Coryphaenoides rupestris]